MIFEKIDRSTWPRNEVVNSPQPTLRFWLGLPVS